MTSDSPTSVRTTVTVEVSRDHAFSVFTERFDTWWPRSHYSGPDELAEAVLEPKAGGRWYTKGTSGAEREWGTVLTWEPPGRLVLGWQLDTEFQYDADVVTEVEIVFTELGPHRTLVELEHRDLDRFGPASTKMRDTFGGDDGWTDLIKDFARRAEATAPIMDTRH
jgi:uncharacterized protein YndB with AHSA1/START domain